MSLIKQAQQLDETAIMIAERCVELSFEPLLLEDLGGTIDTYVQQLKNGRPFDAATASNVSNLLAFAELIGAIRNERTVKPGTASGLLNVYKIVRPGESSVAYKNVMDTIDNLGPNVRQAFTQMANRWGQQLSGLVRNPDKQRMADVANQLVGVSARVKSAVERLQSVHGDSIANRRIQGGQLSRQLGV